jgi:hypothetical protein
LANRARTRVKDEKHLEDLIDEALEETFPASDPPAPAVELVVVPETEPSNER